MNDKKFILATDEVADNCTEKAFNFVIAHPKFKSNSHTAEVAAAALSEYLANESGFTMYTDLAKVS